MVCLLLQIEDTERNALLAAMDEQHKEAIRNLNSVFHENLEPVKIARHLYQNRVIGHDDLESVRKRLTREEQVDHLLEILPLKGPQAYRGFSNALYKEQPFLGALLSRELENIKLGPSTDSVRNPRSLDKTTDSDDMYSLKRSIKEYKEALKSTQRDHQAQKDTNHSLGIEIAQLKESVTQLTQQVREYQEKMESKGKELQTEKDRNDYILKQVSDLKEKFDEKIDSLIEGNCSQNKKIL